MFVFLSFVERYIDVLQYLSAFLADFESCSVSVESVALELSSICVIPTNFLMELNEENERLAGAPFRNH